MGRYLMPDGSTPFAQPGSRRAHELVARGGVSAEGTPDDETTPELLSFSEAEILTTADEFDVDALEALIRQETDGRNRTGVLKGLERLRAAQADPETASTGEDTTGAE